MATDNTPGGKIVTLPMRARTANLGDRDMHPRWLDDEPVLLGDDVIHGKEGWIGFVSAIPSSGEVEVCWWMDDVEEWSDGEEFAPEDLVLRLRVSDGDGRQPE